MTNECTYHKYIVPKEDKQILFSQNWKMSGEQLCSEEYVGMLQLVDDAYKTLCSIWDDLGMHSPDTRNDLNRRYIDSCKDALKAHTDKLINEEESVELLVLNPHI